MYTVMLPAHPTSPDNTSPGQPTLIPPSRVAGETPPSVHHNLRAHLYPHTLQAEWERALATSCTVYVGNLAFTTREEQLYDVFGRVGPIMRIVMGLDKVAKTPCGFAFAIYYTRKVRGWGWG